MDIEATIRDNLGLVYKALGKFSLVDDQDAESMAYEALYKAAQTFDSTKDTRFSTYATCLINNALRLHLRRLNRVRQIKTVSLYTPLGHDSDDDIYLIDTVKQESTIEELLESKHLSRKIITAITIAYDSIAQPTNKAIVTYWCEHDFSSRQREIAEACGVSQAVVSRALSTFRNKLKQTLEELQ